MISKYAAAHEDSFVGRDVDDGSDSEINWIVTRGAVSSVSALERKLSAIKSLYTTKVSRDVDHKSDSEINWIVTRGAVPSVCTRKAS